ncbi:MAG: aminotransferase class I/II-fold pyridoxal phosphate-dependent enzyme [Alphaproteobacteria bacterium]|nr:aminotransferase class I/II-fold pyridoxal phosphate-dependent enzyme [Alphaproteobacteria bacterium]
MKFSYPLFSYPAGIERPNRLQALGSQAEDDHIDLSQNVTVLGGAYSSWYDNFFSYTAATDISKYPSIGCALESISNIYKLPADCLLLGPGSDFVLQYIIANYGKIAHNEIGALLYPHPTFGMLELYGEMHGLVSHARHYTLQNNQFCLSPIDPSVRPFQTIAYTANPDNFTGPNGDVVYTAETYRDFALNIIDIAYMDWSKEPIDLHAVVTEYPNVILVDTFSKRFFAPGIRIGVGIASPDLTKALTAFRLAYELSAHAVSYAGYVSDHQAEASKIRDDLREESSRICSVISATGHHTWVAPGFFISYDGHLPMADLNARPVRQREFTIDGKSFHRLAIPTSDLKVNPIPR